jgi:hypothetical protein
MQFPLQCYINRVNCGKCARKLNKWSLLNIPSVHDNALPYECRWWSKSSSVLVTIISATLMRNWWPPIHQGVDIYLGESSRGTQEEDVKKSDQSMNWLYASWIFGCVTCSDDYENAWPFTSGGVGGGFLPHTALEVSSVMGKEEETQKEVRVTWTWYKSEADLADVTRET